MILGNRYIDPRGDEWRQAGYSSPRVRNRGAIYRYIRMRDGARVRIQSSKFYCCQLSRRDADDIFNVSTGTDERASGSRAASIEDDRLRVGYDQG